MTPTLDQEFDKEFLCQIPGHAVMSDHQFAHDKAGRLPQAFKAWIDSNFIPRADVQKILEQGHGGGNWRRLIIQTLEEAKTPE